MKEFYGFVQQPGAPSSAEPAKGKDYSKSAGAGGVVTLLEMIDRKSVV